MTTPTPIPPAAESHSKLATALHRFIYEYDDADSYRSAWFLHRLELVLNEAQASAVAATGEPVARVNVIDGSTFTKYLTNLPDGLYDLYTTQLSVPVNCECGKCEWRDYYAGANITHHICASCGFKVPRGGTAPAQVPGSAVAKDAE
jgi:hypothetical protein